MLNSYTCTRLQKSLGQQVSVEGNKYGVLLYIGDVHFADGIWCGIELDKAVGDNDGMINNMRYFTCEAYHGLFVPASEMCVLDEAASLVGNHSKLLDCTLKTDESVDSKLQDTHFQDLFHMDYSQHSSQSSQKKTLNESYVISTNCFEESKLSVISEEMTDLFSDSVNFSHSYNNSSLNPGKNMLLASQNRKSFSADSIDKVGKFCGDDFKRDNFADSDESLGIIPDLLEDLTSWDSLIVDLEKPNNLNTMVNLSNNGIQSLILGPQKIVSETNIDGTLISSNSVLPNVSFSFNEEAESPVQTERSFPKFASTPKHEINFSDIDSEDIPTLTLNLSSEFHLDKSGSEKEKQKESQTEYVMEDKVNLIEENLNSLTFNINLNNMYISKNVKSHENNLLNVTLTYPTEIEKDTVDSCLSCEKGTKTLPKICSNGEHNVVEILNTTYEKTDKPLSTKAYKALQDSENSKDNIKENVKPVHFTVNENEEENKVSSFKTTSIFKNDENRQKFKRKSFRRSVGCCGRNTMMKNNANDKQVRRNSLSDCVTILQKNKPVETKVIKPSQISHSSLKYSVKQRSHKSSGDSQEKSDGINYAGKNIPGGLSLKTEYPTSNIEVKPVSKIKSQACLLNETIHRSQLALDVGKTVIKKPRNSMDLPSPQNSSQSTSGKYKVLSKLGTRQSISYETQNQIAQKVDDTASVFKRSLKKPSVFNSVFPEKEKKARRLPATSEVGPSSERNYVSSVRSQSTIPVFKRAGTENKVAGYSSKPIHFMNKGYQSKGNINLNNTILIADNRSSQTHSTVASKKPEVSYSSISTKHTNDECKREGKANLNDTVLLSNHKNTQMHTFKVPRCSEASSIPLSRIPSAKRSKLPQAVKSSDVNPFLNSKNTSKRNSEDLEKSVKNTIPRRPGSFIHKIKSPLKYNLK